MLKIKCDCGEIVVQGETGEGKKHKIFIMEDKPKGEIHKQGNNPHNWTGICSKCQKKNDKSKRKKS